MSGYEIAEWAEFGVGVAGAAAALAGLLFVAVSIDLDRVLELATLPRLAAGTLMLFALPLVAAILLLVPGQSRDALGFELTLLGVSVGAPLLWLANRTPRHEHTTRRVWLFSRLLPSMLVTGLTVVAGLGMILEAFGGLNALAAAIVTAILAGLVNAWVLLVEIHR